MIEKERYRIRKGYVLRKFIDEYLAMPVNPVNEPETKVAILNSVGEFLWSQLQEERTVEELVQAVTNEFDVSADKAQQDIEEFFRKLQEYQFLEVNK